MDISSRWYKAAGASLIAAAVTARYVAKWRRRRTLRRSVQRTRESSAGRCFIGLDLSDPTAAKPRPCDVAVLDSDLVCTFSRWDYQEDGGGIVPLSALGKAFVLAIDGPQGLAGQAEASMRESERAVNAPGRTPHDFPTDGRPYTGLITGSVRLVYHLVTSGRRFRLLGMDGVSPLEANLIEVFPGAAFRALAERPLPAKRTPEGRRARFELLQSLEIEFPREGLGRGGVPNADQLDAAMAAWIAYCFDRGYTRAEGRPPVLDEEAGALREGYIVRPVPPPGGITPGAVAPI